MRLGNQQPSVFDRRRFGYAAVGKFPAGGRARTARSEVILTTLVRRDLVSERGVIVLSGHQQLSTRGVTVLSGKPLLSTRGRTAPSFR